MACTSYAGDLCPLIGLPAKVDDESESDAAERQEEEEKSPARRERHRIARTAPWTLSFLDIWDLASGEYDEYGIRGVNVVAPDRMGPGRPLASQLAGSTEVAIFHSVVDFYYNYSIFVKQVDGKWVVVGQHLAETTFNDSFEGGPQRDQWREMCDAGAAWAKDACPLFVYGLPPFESYLGGKTDAPQR